MRTRRERSSGNQKLTRPDLMNRREMSGRAPFQEVQLPMLGSRIIRNQLPEHRSKLNAKAGDASCPDHAGPAPSITACRWICRVFQAFRRSRGSGTRRAPGDNLRGILTESVFRVFLREGSLFPETPIATEAVVEEQPQRLTERGLTEPSYNSVTPSGSCDKNVASVGPPGLGKRPDRWAQEDRALTNRRS